MSIIHVPIENIPTRYTADWIDQFETAFKRTNTNFITVLGNTNKEIPIQTGSVLDAIGTSLYKNDQISKLIKMISNGEIKDDDVIFFADLWFPGIETLFYIRSLTGIQFKIAGIFHAGTWDSFDFTSRTGMRNWGQHLELSWLLGVDLIFVATQFHKDMIVMNSGEFDDSKIFVTGIPFYAEELRQKYPFESKENLIVFPHRCDEEKHPEKFDRLKRKYPQWDFIKTLEVANNRDEYFKLLARSKVMISFADQETFGYSTVESMALGNYVIVPNRLSYRETVPIDYRYSKDKDIDSLLESFMENPNIPQYPELLKWESSIDKMLRVISVKLKEAVRNRQTQEELVRSEQIRVETEKREKQAQREAKRAEKQSEQSEQQEPKAGE